MTQPPTARPDRTLHLVGNAHIDPVWLWQWEEGYAEARSTFWSAISRIEEDPDFVFTCDQVVLLAWVEESDPELFARIQEQVRAGRWQMVGGWWVEPDCNLPSGESFVRQGLYGQRYLREKFGVTATVGCNVDPFGHNVMLPQILRKQGMSAYCFLRPGPHESDLPGLTFWWQSPDGSRVLAYRIAHEYCSPSREVDTHIEKALASVPPGARDAMVFYGVGNHGGGPTRENLASIRRLDRLGTFGRLELSSPDRYFAAVREAGVADDLPVWSDDLQHHAPGCYSAHSGIKAWVRRAEQALLAAERWAVVGEVVAGLDYPREQLAATWKALLFNQFHDILPGSSLPAAYDDARDQLGEVVAVARRVGNRAQQSIARQVDIPLDTASQPLLVFNSLPWPVRAAVEVEVGLSALSVHVTDADGGLVGSQPVQPLATVGDARRQRLVFDAQLPGLGYRLYRVVVGDVDTAAAVESSGTVIENEWLRVEVDGTTGRLASLMDKRTNVDVFAGSTGDHAVVAADGSDTWGHRVVSYAGHGEPFECRRVRVVERGPLRAVVRIESDFGRSTLVEHYMLTATSPWLDVAVTLDWREPLHLLKLRFPTAVQEPEATYEVPYGSLRRPTDGAEEPGQSWVDVSGTIAGRRAGLTVINDAKHGYDVSGGDIGITAARSPVYAWHDPKELDPDGVYDFQDQGLQRFRCRLVPHGGDWRDAGVVRATAELLAPPRTLLEGFHSGPLPAVASYADDGAGAVVVTAVKGSEDPRPDTLGSDVIIRAVETAGDAGPVRIRLPLLGREIVEDFGPHEIRTFRVPRTPAEPVVETDLIEW